MPKHSTLGAGGLLLLTSATASAVLAKLLFQSQGPGLDGRSKPFEKPWASTTLMFLAMALCLPLAAVGRRLRSWLESIGASYERGSQASSLDEPLLHSLERPSGVPPSFSPQAPSTPQGGTPLSTTPEVSYASISVEGGVPARQVSLPAAPGPAYTPPAPSSTALALILIPTLFDLVATLLLSLGLLAITASAYQMIRSVEIVFTAILSFFVMKRRLTRGHATGIALCTVGIATVGAASMLEGDQLSAPSVSGPLLTPTLIGILVIIAAEAVQAAQVVSEDAFLSNSNLNLAPLTMVGYEGVFGLFIMFGIVLPAAQVLPGKDGGGIHEDSLDSWHMLAHSRQLRLVCYASIAAMAAYNVAGMTVTQSTGATTRTVLETVRTFLVWVLNLLMFYARPAGKHVQLGEPWTAHSWLQAVGFAIVVAGTLVYGHADELQERKLRAKLRWARLRSSLAALVSAHDAVHPLKPPRIAGPATIRTAFLQLRVVSRLSNILAERRALQSAAALNSDGGVAGAAAALGHTTAS